MLLYKYIYIYIYTPLNNLLLDANFDNLPLNYIIFIYSLCLQNFTVIKDH